jgi:hypothetical protein
VYTPPFTLGDAVMNKESPKQMFPELRETVGMGLTTTEALAVLMQPM